MRARVGRCSSRHHSGKGSCGSSSREEGSATTSCTRPASWRRNSAGAERPTRRCRTSGTSASARRSRRPM
eukprot:506383-Alexandrium_andersonii.AAC.1